MTDRAVAAECPACVGIIANPASGKDIRRLVGHATTIDNQGKVGIIRRVLIGAGALGVERIVMMPDCDDLGERALKGVRGTTDPLPEVTFLQMPIENATRDSFRAAEMMTQMGAACIVVLGGDGTMRAVSKGCGQVPLLGISTGTNNVLPTFVEGTIAGLAAGFLAQKRGQVEWVALRHKWLDIQTDDGPPDRALVDVAVLRGRFVGSRAVWRPEEISMILVTRADPASIGISAIAAALGPIGADEPVGMVLRLAAPDDPSTVRRILAPVGPGMLRPVGIASQRTLKLGEQVEIRAAEPLILALDGEREIALPSGSKARLTLRADGPWIVDVPRAMQEMVAQRLLDL